MVDPSQDMPRTESTRVASTDAAWSAMPMTVSGTSHSSGLR